jgi:hypothetical protein
VTGADITGKLGVQKNYHKIVLLAAATKFIEQLNIKDLRKNPDQKSGD